MNITQTATDYIFAHPFVIEGLKKNIINYSKLARTIAAELGVFRPKDFDAILVACRRVSDKLKESKKEIATISKYVSEIKIDIQNKKVLFSVDKDDYLQNMNNIRLFDIKTIEGEKYVTLVSDMNNLKELRKVFKDSTYIENLCQITLHFPHDFSKTFGALSYFTNIFYDNNVNIVDLISLSKEVLVFIQEKDLAKVVRYLKF